MKTYSQLLKAGLVKTLFSIDCSNDGIGCILIQQFPEGKSSISFNSPVFDKAEQKISTLHRELRGVASALQAYKHFVIGSHFPVYLYCDHKPTLSLREVYGKFHSLDVQNKNHRTEHVFD